MAKDIQRFAAGGPVSRPAERTVPLRTIEARPLMPSGRWETMLDTRTNLMARLRRGSKRGEYGRVGEIQALGTGLYRVDVWRIKDEPPAWRRPVLVLAGVLAGLGGLVGLGWWAIMATTSALAGSGDVILAGLVMIGVGALALVFRRPLVEVIVRVK